MPQYRDERAPPIVGTLFPYLAIVNRIHRLHASGYSAPVMGSRQVRLHAIMRVCRRFDNLF
jgi:hypothetical protein